MNDLPTQLLMLEALFAEGTTIYPRHRGKPLSWWVMHWGRTTS